MTLEDHPHITKRLFLVISSWIQTKKGVIMERG